MTSPQKEVGADQGRARGVGEQFAAAPLPSSVCADLIAIKPGPGRCGTNLMTVAEADQMLSPIFTAISEQAFRAGHAAAEETLGAHGSEWLLDAIERSWAEYVADHGLIATASRTQDTEGTGA